MTADNRREEAILQNCLELIHAGKETLESVLEKYPELADELRPRLEAALWLQRRVDGLNPPPGFISRTRKELVTQINQSQKELSRPRARLLEKLTHTWDRLFGKPQLVFKPLLIVLLVIFFVTSGSGVALAAQSALPGESLYPVKISLEQVSLAVSLSDAGDASLHIRYSERRVKEMQVLEAIGEYTKIEKPLYNYQYQINQAVSLIRKISDKDAVQGKTLAQALQQALSSETEQLSGMTQVAPQNVQGNLIQALQVSQSGLIAANQVIDKLEAGGVTPTKTRNTPPPKQTDGVATTGADDQIVISQPPMASETGLPPRQAKKLTETSTVTQSAEVVQTEEPGEPNPSNSPKPSNTHKPTQKPHPTQKPTKSPKPTKTPKK
jgi:hypothetical protein